jgi:probable HAF family extracellular repeat protein
MKFAAPFVFVSCATRSPSRVLQEKEIHNNGNVGRRLFLIVLVLLVNAGRLQAQTYGITDLGALPGNSTSKAYGLNNLGQAVGVSDSGAAIATLFRNGTATNMNTLSADVSVATCISGSSQAAGYNIFYSNPNPTFRAFLYGNGGMTDIQSDSLFPFGTLAYGINSSGMVVGEGWVNNYSFHVFLYANGRMVDLGTFPGGIQAVASAINDVGQVVGVSDGAIAVSKKTTQHFSHAFLYANGKMVDLGVPSGATYSQATAINRNGQIVGVAGFADGSHTVLYSNGVWTDLGKFPGSSTTEATGINLSGQIVGTALFPQQSYHPPIPGKHVPLIVRNGALVDLNTLIASNSGFTITDAIGINDSGQILCNAKNSSNVTRAVLLSPK